VTVRDVGQVDGAAFVAMDLHPLTLGRRLVLMERLPEGEVVKLGIGIAAALAVAHASQVIHRDIKPDNILLDQEGEAVVADFGLARALAAPESLGDTNQVQGTPHYFSPEQARGKDLDGRSDLYSLGVTLYRAATGKLPFEGDDWYAVARHHIESPPPAPRATVPELSAEFESLLLRLLAKDPGARYANAVQLIDALAALPSAPDRSSSLPRLGSNTIDAFRASPASPSRFWPAAAVLLVGAVIGWMVWDRRVSTPVDSASLPAEIPRPDTTVVGGTPGDTAERTPIPVTATPPRPDSAPKRRPPSPLARTARLEVTTLESAGIYLDNRLVGTGRWNGEVPTAARVTLRAVVPDAPTSCRAALRDTVLTGLAPGQRVALTLPVRGCAVVRYRVEPRDARVQFTSVDGGRSFETRADSVQSYSLPWGRYVMRISAPYCIVFSDTIVVERDGSESPVPRKLVCS
jgi:serine/threonine-protein kinase